MAIEISERPNANTGERKLNAENVSVSFVRAMIV